MKEKIAPYLPGIILFVVTLILGLAIYKDYGMGWDEPLQRDPALLSWNYAVNGDQTLFKTETDNHGAGFELVLLFVEKSMKLTDTRDIYLMRHIFTHVFFLLSCFAGYILVYRLFRDKWIASIGFIMFVFSPRIYAHSYFNSKDLPFLCMILVTLAISQIAFDKKKIWWFALLGLACGYGTGIRIMGIMYGLLIGLMLLIDLILNIRKKEKPTKTIINMAVFTVGFCLSLYLAWPYLWKEPVAKFIESFAALAHFKFQASVLIQGQYIEATKLPWTYFPIWFGITTPILWLIAGFVGFGWILYDFAKKPAAYVENGNERNFLFYILSFAGPVLSVWIMHSVIYDDWRHLYFVYPAFVLLGLYAIDKVYKTKMKKVILGACGLQVAVIAGFFIQNHPHEQVYFNSLVSQEDEYLRANYEMEYWGCSFKQALEYILEHDNSKSIKISANFSFPMHNNVMLLRKEDRDRFVIVDNVQQADYFLTNFRMHPADYPSNNVEYEIKVANSTIMRVYKLTNIRPTVTK